MFTTRFYVALTALFSILMLSSCAVTTESTEASSDTFHNTSDALTDFTSSTSPRDDDEAHAALVLKFVKANFSRLRSDIAVGEGEYLGSLAVLLSIDEADREQFFALTKNNFNNLYASSETSAEELIAHLHREMAQVQL